MSDKSQATPEQIAAYEQAKKDRMKHQEQQLPILEMDLKYLTLLADIEESHLRRETARMRFANLTAPPEPESKEDVSTKE